MTTEPNFDTLRERLRERVSKLSEEEYNHGSCLNCNAQLTQADIDEGCCTQCGDGIPDDTDDESRDEHLWN